MKSRLFADTTLSPEEIADAVADNAHNVEDGHTFLKPFTEEELEEAETVHLKNAKKLRKLYQSLKEVTEPIKAEIKPLAKETDRIIENLTKGGVNVTEKVFLYPDYTEKLMGLYDSRGFLISIRPFTVAERQLSLNSSKTFHIDSEKSA